MNNLTRFAVVLALSLSCGDLYSLAGQAVSPTTPQTKKNQGATVSGRITLQGKGKGGVFVGIRPSELGGPQMAPAVKAVTDADGNYRLTDLQPGSYQILPMAPAYVVSSAGKSLILAEGESVDGIDFSIVRGAVVTGRVSYSDGKPVIDESVYLVPAQQTNQRGPRFTGSSRFQTDDRGVYRMFGIAPGRYKVCIGVPDDSYFPNRNRPTFERVYYPSVVKFDEAKVVELGEDSEATNIDITVGESMQHFAASGVVVDGETNQPVPNLGISVRRVIEANPVSFLGTSTRSNGRGEFRLENLTPGKYSLVATPQQGSDTRVDALLFEIVDQDVTTLSVKTSKGAVVSGFVVLEGNRDKEIYARLAKLRLVAFVREANPSAVFGRPSTIGADGSFRIGGLNPGAANFALTSLDPQSRSGFIVARIERDGVVQPRSGVEITAGEQIAGLRIVVIYGSGSVRGTVKFDNGPPPAGIHLMVRLIKTGDSSYPISPQRVDARGRFVFAGVPAGTYEVSVIGSIPQLRGRQPTVKQSVTVIDGAATDVELVINTDQNTTLSPGGD